MRGHPSGGNTRRVKFMEKGFSKIPVFLWGSVLVFLLGSCGNERGPLNVQSMDAASIQITDSPVYDFGQQWVDGYSDKTFTLTNLGLKPATAMTSSFNLSLSFSYAAGAYPGMGGTCGATLDAGVSCTVVVRFAPKVTGTFEDVLAISFHNGISPQVTAAPRLKAKGAWELAGILDVTFNGQGRVFATAGLPEDRAGAMVVAQDGKILVAGESGNGPGQQNLMVGRFLASGPLDATFGTNGFTLIPVGAGAYEVRDIAVQVDGRILIAGQAQGSGVIARLHADGSLDQGFGTGGVAAISDASGPLGASAVVVLPDRKIVVAGTRDDGSQKDVWLSRLESNGVLDTTFGSSGKVFTAVGASHDIAHAMIQGADGKLVVCGSSVQGATTDFLALKYGVDGALDPAFGTAGVSLIDIGSNTEDVCYALKAQNDGKLVLAGDAFTTSREMAVARLSAAGLLDTTFAGTGKTTISLGGGAETANGVVIQSDHKVVVTGSTNGDIGLVRFLPNGSLDPLFGNLGKVVTSLGSGQDDAFATAVTGNGKILLSGRSFNGADYDLFVARYWP